MKMNLRPIRKMLDAAAAGKETYLTTEEDGDEWNMPGFMEDEWLELSYALREQGIAMDFTEEGTLLSW